MLLAISSASVIALQLHGQTFQSLSGLRQKWRPTWIIIIILLTYRPMAAILSRFYPTLYVYEEEIEADLRR